MAQSSAASDRSSSSSSSSTFLPDDEKNNSTPSSSVFLSRLADTVRDTRSKVEQKKTELNATMQEKLPEWKSRGAMYGNLARETGMGWSKKGKDAVDRWKKQHQDPVDDIHIFGMSLDAATSHTKIEQNDHIPAVIRRSIEYLDIYGIHEVGIYRMSGSSIAVSKLRAIFDAGNDMNFQNEHPDPHVVSALLKTYLRELPNPIIPPSIAGQYAQHIKEFVPTAEGGMSTTDTLRNNPVPPVTPELLECIRRVTSSLPPCSYALLRLLCKHLNRVVQCHEDNRMTTTNLTLIFTPTLRISHALFYCMVDYPNAIFEDDSPSAGPITTTANAPHTTPPPLPLKPARIRTVSQMAIPQANTANHAKTRSDTDLLTIAQLTPPPKPSRSPQPKSAFDFHLSQSVPASPETTKPRSKSLSSTSISPPLWKRPSGNGKVGEIGRQFESLGFQSNRR